MSDQSEREAKTIDVKEAIRTAKTLLSEMLDGESFNQVGLEEVKFDDRAAQWIVTLGLNRPWNKEVQQTNPSIIYAGNSSSTTRQIRTYKVMRIDAKTGELISMEGTGD